MLFTFSKTTKDFYEYVSQISTETIFDSGIETTIILYQIKFHIKLHCMIRPRYGESFLYPNSIVNIPFRGFKVFEPQFSFYLLPVLFNRAIK